MLHVSIFVHQNWLDLIGGLNSLHISTDRITCDGNWLILSRYCQSPMVLAGESKSLPWGIVNSQKQIIQPNILILSWLIMVGYCENSAHMSPDLIPCSMVPYHSTCSLCGCQHLFPVQKARRSVRCVGAWDVQLASELWFCDPGAWWAISARDLEGVIGI